MKYPMKYPFLAIFIFFSLNSSCLMLLLLYLFVNICLVPLLKNVFVRLNEDNTPRSRLY